MRRIANDVDAEVLSAFTVENLKSDIGIESFGIRTKIMNAINELGLAGEWKWIVSSSAADVTSLLNCPFLLPLSLRISLLCPRFVLTLVSDLTIIRCHRLTAFQKVSFAFASSPTAM
jgi:hypothetical protein